LSLISLKFCFKGAQACILAYSASDRASYHAIESWKNKVEHECGQIITFVVQNKIDLVDETQVNWYKLII
jgi:Ras-related protein Rab-23